MPNLCQICIILSGEEINLNSENAVTCLSSNVYVALFLKYIRKRFFSAPLVHFNGVLDQNRNKGVSVLLNYSRKQFIGRV